MKHLLTLIFVFVTAYSWSQKKELKQAQKLFKSAKISEAKASLETNKTLLEGAELKYFSAYNLLLSQISLAEKEYQASYDFLQLASKDPALKTKVKDQSDLLAAEVVQTAIDQSENKEFLASANNLYLSRSQFTARGFNFSNTSNISLSQSFSNRDLSTKSKGSITSLEIELLAANLEARVTTACNKLSVLFFLISINNEVRK